MNMAVKSKPKSVKLKSALTNASHYGKENLLEEKRCKSTKVETPIAKIVVKKEKLSDDEADKKYKKLKKKKNQVENQRRRGVKKKRVIGRGI